VDGFERQQNITDRFLGDKDLNSLLLQARLILPIRMLKVSHKVNRGFRATRETKLSRVQKRVSTHSFLDRNLPKPGSSFQP